MKALLEKRNLYLEELKGLADATEAIDKNRIDELRTLIEEVDSQIEAKRLLEEEEQRDFKPAEKEDDENAEEMRAFADYLRGVSGAETRANWTISANGAVLPETIANKIIDKVHEIAPIIAMASTFRSKGDLVFPVYDDTTEITANYATEFTALSSTAAAFSKVTLGGHLFGALTKVSRSLINNAAVDVAGFVIDKLAFAMADFLRGELIAGTGATGHFTGLTTSSNTVSASASAVTADNIMETYFAVPQPLQANAVWVMNRTTLLALKKLKATTNEYLLQLDLTAPMGYTILGKPIYVDEKIDNIGASKKSIIYGDLSGLYVNSHEDIALQPLLEKYADEHAVGYVAWAEMDSKIVEPQKFAVVAHAAS